MNKNSQTAKIFKSIKNKKRNPKQRKLKELYMNGNLLTLIKLCGLGKKIKFMSRIILIFTRL